MVCPDRFSKLTELIILHPLVVSFILLSSYPVFHNIPLPFWFIILVSSAIAIILLFLQKWLSESFTLYILFLSDLALIAAMIHYTGGVESMFSLLFILVIILASMYLFRTGAYIIGLSSVVIYFVLIMCETKGAGTAIQMVMYRFYIFALLFMFTSILSGALSTRYQKGTEEARQLRLTTEEIIKNIPSGIITINRNGDIIYTNIPEGKLRTMVHLHLAKFLGTPDARSSIELKVSKRYYVLSCARIYNSRAGLGVLQDLTELRMLEEKSRIAEQTRLLAELGGSLAHEIRNPLASIRGALEVINESMRRGKVTSFIAMALNETIRLNEIVTDFLNFAQFTPTKRNRHHIVEIINEAVISMMQHQNKKKNITIKRKDGDFYCYVDLNKLKSAIVNLLDNACEVSKDGQTIEIKSYIKDNQAVIEVQDYGPGINPKELKKIFSPFYTTKKGGTGLGLAIARNIIEAHGGKITVESKPGKGSKFIITLPLSAKAT